MPKPATLKPKIKPKPWPDRARERAKELQDFRKAFGRVGELLHDLCETFMVERSGEVVCTVCKGRGSIEASVFHTDECRLALLLNRWGVTCIRR